MSDRFHPVPIDTLLRWWKEGERTGDQWLGLPAGELFVPREEDPFRMRRYGHLLETPVGVAAGPHTQLAHNIAAAWLTGARWMELKTVQTLDGIEVAKPCIDMDREGYNCEWSQELSLERSAREYVKAWVLIHLLRRLRGLEGEEAGVVFNLSVGYDLEGIRKPNMQRFLDTMEDASELIARELDVAATVYPEAAGLEVPPRISDSVTLSTMHGCPPEEIESIARYLMEQRGLHTAVKLNPTLLGPEDLREILARRGYEHLVVPDEAFGHDLKYPEALEIIRSLSDCASGAGVQFGLKLTNTLEVKNVRRILPEDQEQLYLSGDAIHPLAVTLAERLRGEFGPELDISFCAGADAFNTPDLLAADLGPVTVCTDLLRPGGYTRLAQYFEVLRDRMARVEAASLDDFVRNSGEASDRGEAALRNLRRYASSVREAENRGSAGPPRTKTLRALPRYDCALAPCVQSCAIDQDIPDYLYWTAQGEFDTAWEAVLRANPLPRITGMVCDHLCMASCVRGHYEDPILIREVKRFIAEGADEEAVPGPKAPNGIRVAILGAGPTGLAAAWFLALEGCEVHIYEARETAGGMAAHAIPAFRIENEALAADIERIRQVGVRVHTGVKVDRRRFEELREDHDALYIGVGAQAPRTLGIAGENAEGVWDQLAFLERVREGVVPQLGDRVAVIGGGNSAVDAARTAKRLVGDEGTVTVLYRRTRAQMPADREEVEALDREGVPVEELVAPVELVLKNGRLTGVRCVRMKLGEADASGRARPVPVVGSEFDIALDSMITALGQEVVLDFLPEGALAADPDTLATGLDGVYAGGDAIRGASTLIKAVRDGRRATDRILSGAGQPPRAVRALAEKGLTLESVQAKQARKVPGVEMPVAEGPVGFDLVHATLSEQQAREEAARCLHCSDICNICVAVCPNRANVALPAAPRDLPLWRVQDGSLRRAGSLGVTQPWQIVNIADACNECGNCTIFCPSAQKPWHDKPRIALTEASFREEPEAMLLLEDGLKAHHGTGEATLRVQEGEVVYETEGLRARFTWPAFEGIQVEGEGPADLAQATDMAMLYSLLQSHYLGTSTRKELV